MKTRIARREFTITQYGVHMAAVNCKDPYHTAAREMAEAISMKETIRYRIPSLQPTHPIIARKEGDHDVTSTRRIFGT